MICFGFFINDKLNDTWNKHEMSKGKVKNSKMLLKSLKRMFGWS